MAPSPRPPPRSRKRPARNHNRSASAADLLPRERPSPRDEAARRNKRHSSARATPPQTATPTTQSSHGLSAGSLAKLNALNEKAGWGEYDNVQARLREKEDRWDVKEKERARRVEKPETRRRRDGRDHNHYRERERDTRRRVSGPLLEEGGNYRRRSRPPNRGGNAKGEKDAPSRGGRRKCWIILGIVVVLLAIIVGVAVGVSKQKGSDDGGDDGDYSVNPDDTTPPPSNDNLNNIKPSSIPQRYKGSYYDPFSWYDTTDFNVTFTTEAVGGLPIMGLNSTWDNSIQANDDVPPLTEKWDYGTRKIRGMNLGGWLSIEPFITPSFFEQFDTADGVIDEWTLTTTLGPAKAATTLEQHYSAFVNEQVFADIQAAGFDHIRISYSYWAVTTYPGDPYVPMISWRYLLRGIEWARRHGLRVNLDLHGVPGSQNGWNHSGRQGIVRWLNGTEGEINGQRTLDIHTQLATFFSQPRYQGLVTMYGLVNEPRMVDLDTQRVAQWTIDAANTVRAAGLSEDVVLVFGDGFMGLTNWKDSPLQQTPNLLLDAHQYVIFNVDQIILDHSRKIDFACKGWTQQSRQSMSTRSGFGNFLCGEWSQADTDCVEYLNNVGTGSRWEGNLILPNATLSVLNPTCPTGNSPRCDCAGANADPTTYSDAYKLWLRMFAEAQMHSFEQGWGWFYWTWRTETAVQWSYELGLRAGILPTDVRYRDFDCSQDIPDFGSMGLSETY